MTGERSKIRSGEFLVFRSRCRCAYVWVWFFCALQKSYFPLAFVFAPDQKAHFHTQFIGWIHVIEFSYAQSNNVSRNYIVIGTRLDTL